MKLTNKSPYATRVLKRILTATFHEYHNRTAAMSWNVDTKPWWESLEIRVTTGRKPGGGPRGRVSKGRTGGVVNIVVPPLTGDEFIPRCRVDHGAPAGKVKAGLATADLTVLALNLYRKSHRPPKRRAPWRVPPNLPSLPEFVPLHVLREQAEAPPRDLVTARYERIIALEKRWLRKAKLAQTKLKKLRAKRKRYEKHLLARQIQTKE